MPVLQEIVEPPSVEEAPPSYVAGSPATSHDGASRYRVERYGRTRHWAVYDGEELLAVTVYKKGAIAVAHRLQDYESRIADLSWPEEKSPACGRSDQPSL